MLLFLWGLCMWMYVPFSLNLRTICKDGNSLSKVLRPSSEEEDSSSFVQLEKSQ